MKYIKLTQFKLFIWIGLLLFLIANDTFSQTCPSFKIREIRNVEGAEFNGLVVININGSKLYSTENFEIRQKEGSVTGSIGYDVKINISRDELVISGLKKSDELYLKEYVILFSDRGCNNSALIEVGTFEIK